MYRLGIGAKVSTTKIIRLNSYKPQLVRYASSGTSRSGGGKFLLTIGALTGVTGAVIGTSVYAKYDPSFAKYLDENVPIVKTVVDKTNDLILLISNDKPETKPIKSVVDFDKFKSLKSTADDLSSKLEKLNNSSIEVFATISNFVEKLAVSNLEDVHAIYAENKNIDTKISNFKNEIAITKLRLERLQNEIIETGKNEQTMFKARTSIILEGLLSLEEKLDKIENQMKLSGNLNTEYENARAIQKDIGILSDDNNGLSEKLLSIIWYSDVMKYKGKMNEYETKLKILQKEIEDSTTDKEELSRRVFSETLSKMADVEGSEFKDAVEKVKKYYQVQIDAEKERRKEEEKRLIQEKRIALLNQRDAFKLEIGKRQRRLFYKFNTFINNISGSIEEAKKSLEKHLDEINETEGLLELVRVCDQWHSSLAINPYEEKTWHFQKREVLPQIMNTKKRFSDDNIFINTIESSLGKEVIQRGVYTRPALVERFVSVEKSARKVEMIEEDTYSLPLFVLAHLRSFFTIRANTVLEKDMSELPTFEDLLAFKNSELISRARYVIERGDIKKGIHYLVFLKGPAAYVVSDWVDDARDVLKVEMAAECISKYVSLLVKEKFNISKGQ